MDSPNSQRIVNEQNKLKEELNNLKAKAKEDDFLTDDQRLNESITREYLNKKFKDIVSTHLFNDFSKENKLILNRIHKQFSCINDNIVKSDISINKCMEKSVNDLVDFNKNITFNIKKQTDMLKDIIKLENQTNKKDILIYFIDLSFKLFIFYIFYKYVLSNDTCKV